MMKLQRRRKKKIQKIRCPKRRKNLLMKRLINLSRMIKKTDFSPL